MTDRTDARCWAFAGLALVAGIALLLFLHPSDVNQDVAMYAQAGALILDGKVPYVDIVDLNPPLIMYLNVPAAVLSILTGISPGLAFALLTLLWIPFSAWQVFRLLALVRPDYTAADRGLIAFAWIHAHAAVWHQGDLGQRDALVILLYVPYMLLSLAGGGVRRDWAFATGFLCGIGLALKPHYLLLFALIELVLLVSGRRVLRPEVAGVGAALLLYALHWLVVPAPMREAFFGRWLPAIRASYGAYGADLATMTGWMIFGEHRWIQMPLILGWIALVVRHPARPLLGTLAVALGASTALTVLQGKGFSYHLVPAQVLTTMILGVLLVEMTRGISDEMWRFPRRWVAAPAVFVLVAMMLHSGARHARIREEARAPLTRLIEAHSWPGDSVVVLATNVKFAYPVLTNRGLYPGTRYLFHFPIAFAYRQHPPAAGAPYRKWSEAPPIEKQYLDDLAADIRTDRPEVILVVDQDTNQGCPPGFNLLRYMEASGFLETVIAPDYAVATDSVPGLARVFLRRK